MTGMVQLGDLYANKGIAVQPDKFATEEFELFSVPSYEHGTPDVRLGCEIGSSKVPVEPGDVLVCRIVPHIRRAWAVPERNGRRQIASSEWIVLRDARFDPSYLRHFLLSDVFHRQFMATVAGVGGSLVRARPAAAATILVPLPPLPEQRRIASILDQADALRAKRQAALAALDELLGSIFYSRFQRQTQTATTIGDHLVERGGMRTGPFGSQLLHSEFVDEGIPVLGIDNVVDNTFRWGRERFISREKYEKLRRYTVHPGDVLITIMGSVGKTAVVPDDIGTAISTKHLCCISLDQSTLLPDYVQQYFLRHPVSAQYLASTAKGAIMDGLNMRLIRDMPIVVPAIDEQRDFVTTLKRVRGAADAHKGHLAKLDELFASLQHRAFTGQL